SKDEIQPSASRIKTLEDGNLKRHSSRYTENRRSTTPQNNRNAIQFSTDSPRTFKNKGIATPNSKQTWSTSSLRITKSPVQYGNDIQNGISRSASDTYLPSKSFDVYTVPYMASDKSPIRSFPTRELQYK
ncbi:hypothetical protein DFH28DRAFT_846061, partial [Melampsora americana]